MRAGVISVLGVHSASVVHVVAAVAGLSAIVAASALAFTAVKVLGAVYLVALGVQAIARARRLAVSSDGAVVATVSRTHRRIFREAFVVNLLNPKTAIFFLAFLPQFVDGERSHVWTQTLVLGIVFIAVGIVSDGVYAVVGGHVGARFQRRATARLRATR